MPLRKLRGWPDMGTRHRDQADTETNRTWRQTELRHLQKLETDWTQRSTGLVDQPNLRTNKNRDHSDGETDWTLVPTGLGNRPDLETN